MRNFESGATRNDATNKFRYEGFLSPACIEEYGKYMHKHRKQANGELRSPDNWQKGIEQDVYIDSIFRHFMDLWFIHRGYERYDDDTGEKLTIRTVCCALLFNVFGYLFEELKLQPAEEEEEKTTDD